MTMLPWANDAALRALKSGEVDAAVFVDGAQNQAVWAALHDPHLRLMSYGHADAYPRLLAAARSDCYAHRVTCALRADAV